MPILRNIKKQLKKNPTIVSMYEAIMSGWHKIHEHILNGLKFMIARITVKTHFRYGDQNKDKTFFVISCDYPKMGLYSSIFYMLPYIDYALKKKWIPVIDFKKSYLPALQDKEKMGKENAWEYYYEQPVKGYTLDEVYQSRNVILKVDKTLRVRQPNWIALFSTQKNESIYWSKIIQSYIRLNDKLKNRIAIERKKIFKENCRILGVGVRAAFRAGMLRNNTVHNGHPKQPTCEELLDIVAQKMENWKCDYIFLSCDDREYHDKFISHFGNRCCYLNRRLVHYFKHDRAIMDAEERQIEYADCTSQERTNEYITEIYLLAECNCLYGCIGGGSEFAYYLNDGKYDHIEVYNKGLYKVEK